MESHIHNLSLPTHIIINELGWTTPLWILTLSALFVYTVSAAGHPPSLKLKNRRIPPRARLAEANQRKAEKARLVDLENKRVRILEGWATDGFPFRHLPPELQLSILAYSSEWMSTYRALVLVSRSMHRSTLRACLPYMAITLSSSEQLQSFLELVQRPWQPRYPEFGTSPQVVGTLVHHLWVTPLKREDHVLGYAILKTCTNIRSLACNARTLSIITRSSKLQHTMCTDITLLLSRSQWEAHLLSTPSGPAFMRQITHLRLLSEQNIPQQGRFSGLTHLSYFDRPPLDEEDMERPSALENRIIFPSLRSVVLTRRCHKKLRTQRIDSELALIHVLHDFTEMEIWWDAVRGNGLWRQAVAAHVRKKLPRN